MLNGPGKFDPNPSDAPNCGGSARVLPVFLLISSATIRVACAVTVLLAGSVKGAGFELRRNAEGVRATAQDLLQAAATAPDPPVAKAASSVTDTGFTARWSATTGATGCRLDVSSSSGFGSYVAGYQDVDVGNATNRSIAGLSASTTYYYRVRAYNSIGTSANSSVINATTTGNAPAAPVAKAGSCVTDTGFTAHWTASTGATGYRLDVSSSSSFGSYVTGYQDLEVGNATSRSIAGLS